MNSLQDIRTFIEVARTGSFVRAGDVLNQSNSAVSKAIARLEAQLGAPLLTRTTRHLALTEEGRTYFERCLAILDDLEAANDAVAASSRNPQGLIRVHFPLLWAREHVITAFPAFQALYPQVRVQMIFGETSVQASDPFQLSVQVGPAADGHVVVRTLCRTRSLIVASPDYIRRRGMPRHPDDLAAHDCIRFMMSDRLTPAPWDVLLDGKVRSRPVAGRLDVSDPQAMVDAALVSLGLIQGPDFLLRPHLRSGALRQVLQKFEADGPAIALVWPKNRYMPLRFRVFIDWLLGLGGDGAAGKN